MTTKFDKLVESILSEMMPATSEYDPSSMGATVSQKISELPGKSQHWAALQKLSPEDRTKVVKAIIEKVFADNDERTYSLSIDNPEDLKEAIKDAIKSVSEEIPEFKIGGKWAIQFLADRLANKELLGNVKYTTASGEDVVNKEMTQKEVRQALRKALEEPLTDGNGEEDEELEAEPESKEVVSSKLAYNPRADYYLKTEDEIPSGKLSGDLRIAHDRLSVMAGEVHSGAEFVKQLEKTPGLGTSHVKQLLDLGIFEPADEETSNVGDTEGFKETEEEYIDRITRAAREDYRSADLNPKYGGIQFD
jgi:hypothetical protein